MDTLINFLINNSDKYDLDIIDDSENHDMIFIGFPSPATITCGDVKLLNIKEIKYNTYTHEYVICYEDDLEIGYIPNEKSISRITLSESYIWRSIKTSPTIMFTDN